MLSLSILPYDGSTSLDPSLPIIARRNPLFAGGASSSDQRRGTDGTGHSRSRSTSSLATSFAAAHRGPLSARPIQQRNDHHTVHARQPQDTGSPRHVSFPSPIATAYDLAREDQKDAGVDAKRITQVDTDGYAAAEAAAATTDNRLGVRLASDDILLPMVDRCAEVSELLFRSPRNAALHQHLCALFERQSDIVAKVAEIVDSKRGSPCLEHNDTNDWTLLKRLLTQIPRAVLPDRMWLRAVCTIVFGRSAQVWCTLGDCLGARHLDYDVVDEAVAALKSEPLFDFNTAAKLLEGSNARGPTSLSGLNALLDTGDFTQAALTLTERLCKSPVEVEVLHDVPLSFRTCPAAYMKQGPWAKDGNTDVEKDDQTPISGAVDIPLSSSSVSSPLSSSSSSTWPSRSRAASVSSSLCTSVSAGSCEEVSSLLKDHRNSFAGVRLRLKHPSGHVGDEGASNAFTASTARIARTRSLSAASARQGASSYHKHRRLSSLSLFSIDEANGSEKLNSSEESHRATGSASLRRMFEAQYGGDPSKAGSGSDQTRDATLRPPGPKREGNLSEDSARGAKQRSQACISAEFHPARSLSQLAGGSSSKANTFDRPLSASMPLSMSMSSCLDEDSRSSSASSDLGSGSEGSGADPHEKRLLGLMPDGRTRHPSSSSSDSRSLAARDKFRNEVRTSASSVASPISAASFLQRPSPSPDTHPMVPGGVASLSQLTGEPDRASPDQKEANQKQRSPPQSHLPPAHRGSRARERSQGREAGVSLGDSFDMFCGSSSASEHKAPSRAAEHEESSRHAGRLGMPTTSGVKGNAVPSALIFPVPPNARFSRSLELNKGLEEARANNTAAWQHVAKALGSRHDAVTRIKDIVTASGERKAVSDEALVERLARRCFALVDMGSGGDGDGHGDGDEARAGLQGYFDDIDGYEERWTGFAALLRDIWLVDDAVLSKVHERCGPAERFALDKRRHARPASPPAAASAV